MIRIGEDIISQVQDLCYQGVLWGVNAELSEIERITASMLYQKDPINFGCVSGISKSSTTIGNLEGAFSNTFKGARKRSNRHIGGSKL